MKTKTWILLLTALLLVCVGLSVALLLPGEKAARVEVWSEGELKYTLDLSVDQTVTIETAHGSNVITIKDGKIAVTEADCPDGYCVARGFCDRGASIVCLPHRLVIKFVGSQQVDSVVG